MSGKPAPASVGGVRAGVPAAAAPRLLVYVDPRQLEPGAAASDTSAPPAPAPPPAPSANHEHLQHLYLSDNHLTLPPRNTIYRHNNQNNLPNTVFFKPVNDNDNKVTVYTPTENCATQRAELYPVSQQYLKDSCIKFDVGRNNQFLEGNKQDCGGKLNTDFPNTETFHGRIPVESADLATYQQRCSGTLGADTMPIQQIAVRHGQNQYSESVTVHSGDGSSGDRDISVGKSYVNYQFLEQSVSHQSIVNQSISILNQQVGVSRGIGGEVESPQLVRTADGVVLAVLPAPQPPPQPADAHDNTRTVHSDSPQTITVPLGWKRIITGTSVLYISPSGTALSTHPQLREYLQTAGTCKCGLPCPLRPETAFSFDPKVVSKPYQPASGAELTKLCNHKRKLLATLQARAQSPATPPPQNTEQRKAMSTEVTVLKKKMKRPSFPANVGMLVQRERPLAEFKQQDTDLTREMSTAVTHQRAANGQPLTNFGTQHIVNTQQDDTTKQDTLVQRSSHYLTVNNGWISHQSIDAQKANQPPANPIGNSMNPVGMPVLGTNGQVIGVNTGYNKHPTNNKNIANAADVAQKDDRKDMALPQNLQPNKYSHKEEESQIFCGLNQPLTPEVMQKINEQQQIFIQQNQKQIEIAMKGYKNQLAENVNQNKPQGQYVSQAQLVIQNGTVVKTNPAKTPPWQVKRNDSANQITSPNPKLQKIDNNDFEEQNANISEDSSSSFSSFSSNEQVITQGMCPRVPPLPQHYNIMGQQWPAIETTKKKSKASNAKTAKKKTSPTDNKTMTFGNNGMRSVHDSKGNTNDDIATNNVPSFMDDPSGYLAQQTVLLNNTISRQVGMNNTYGSSPDGSNNLNFTQSHIDKSKLINKPTEVHNIYKHNVPNPSSSPNTTPDSSVVTDKTDNSMLQCCKGCNMSSKSNSPEYVENHNMRMKYMKHNMYKMEYDHNSCMSSPKQGMQFEDNPVTSSTFIERSPALNDNRSPIQAGTVSTSNVSLTETLQPPEPSPTLSNSSRNTDTPHSSGSNHSQMQPNTTYHMPSPAYSASGRDNFGSNPSTPGNSQGHPYNSPGPPGNQSISGTQMMHFISNHNINKNLMEVDNISMVGVRPGIKPQEILRIDSRRRIENTMPGYCPPPHLGGGPPHSLVQACYVQSFVTTMASGFSVTRDTVTSVLAGKANTATTSINASQANFVRPPPPPSVNLATTYAIPNNQPDPFLNSVNLPTSYPLHIAGTTAQNMISKSPLEMVQNVIGSLPSKTDSNNSQATSHSQINRRTTPGQILISSTGQIIVSNNQMPPPPPKAMATSTMSSPPGSNAATVSPAGQLVNQSAVVVNTLPAPFVLQPPMMAVDGQVVHQNTVLPHIVASGLVSGQSPNDNSRQVEVKSHQSYVQGVAMLSPESLKKRNKKKKSPASNITNVLQITAPQQNPSNIMVHSSPQQNSSPQFSPRGFQLSPNNNISPTPMLQALTIVPGKSGTPAHIVMNGQGNAGNFSSQQIITNTSPSQQINLLQPVNLINNASGVMSNFPAFQQFIVPNLGGMVMTADGTAIIQDNSAGMPMQLQLQTVNGQNVLTPVQNPGVFTAGTNGGGGVVIRSQNQQSKMIQSQHSPGAQFLSPNGQVVVNGPNFNGQLSPLLANLSPTSVAFNAAGQPQQVRTSNLHQEFVQANQMGQALMVPLSPKRPTPANRTNSTFVQNTTIVQQQTIVSNSSGAPVAQVARHAGPAIGVDSEGDRHSVSTQTRKSPNSAHGAAGAHGASAGSPPDTTTHSPLGAVERAQSPRHYAARCLSTQANYADTTTSSPEPADATSSAMVQCVSSSEQDMTEACDNVWPTHAHGHAHTHTHAHPVAPASAPASVRPDYLTDNDSQNIITNMPMRQRVHNPVESTDIHHNQNMTAPSPSPPTHNNQHVIPMTSNYYERPQQTYKRKNDFGDGSTYRSDKIMRTSTYSMVHAHKDNDYEVIGSMADKSQLRHYQPSGSGAETSMAKYERHRLAETDDVEEDEEEDEKPKDTFSIGDVVWGPVRGYSSWPGKLQARGEDGRWRVRWFGAAQSSAGGGVHAEQLLTLTEGLEAHHAARNKHRKSRKLNTLLENAIQEAMAELDKKSGAGACEGAAPESSDVTPITDTPKRSKKVEKVRNKEKSQKKNPNKTGDGARLRSSR